MPFALTWQNVFLVILGALVGTVIGMLPGIGPVNAIARFIPHRYYTTNTPESVLILFASIFYGAQYGNSISSILLNVPGTSASAVTAIDGYALAKKGQGGKALAMSAIASFVWWGIIDIFIGTLCTCLIKTRHRFWPCRIHRINDICFLFAIEL